MTRLASFTVTWVWFYLVTLAPLWFAGAASAHPGHSTPHLLHEGDTLLLWGVFAAAVALGGAVWVARRRS